METAFAILVLSISTTLQWWRIRVLERRLDVEVSAHGSHWKWHLRQMDDDA